MIPGQMHLTKKKKKKKKNQPRIQRGGQGVRTPPPPPGKSQVIWVSIVGNEQLDPPGKRTNKKKNKKTLCQSLFCQTDLDPPLTKIPGSAHKNQLPLKENRKSGNVMQ